MRIVVSACLLGKNCKYNGGNNLNPAVIAALQDHTVIPVCPEVQGGMPTPRTPAEIVDGVVTDLFGQSVDQQFKDGATAALKQALAEGAEVAILQPRSPSCGASEIYDGTFSGRLIPGAGIFARQLRDAGIKVIDADHL